MNSKHRGQYHPESQPLSNFSLRLYACRKGINILCRNQPEQGAKIVSVRLEV
ncbi:hypothetical protein SD961_11365 [Erwinia sp. MMLR14_017]|uniref:hypothetical protein n=1 Tax=Erwinia sp. MMLR14_017 TaxID=3093842 RepID=UPI0029906F14|nr:hypothetical protein [Erwinia sp. MMLR14_017]MDW8846482.1 hypothetical protein [Erwinia sp. MMLR14_017]